MLIRNIHENDVDRENICSASKLVLEDSKFGYFEYLRPVSTRVVFRGCIPCQFQIEISISTYARGTCRELADAKQLLGLRQDCLPIQSVPFHSNIKTGRRLTWFRAIDQASLSPISFISRILIGI